MRLLGPLLCCIWLTACTTHGVLNPKYTQVRSSLVVNDINNYGCAQPLISDIEYIIDTGVRVTETELHDHYSTTGCSVSGTLLDNGLVKDFTFDFGGLIYINDGTTIACGPSCCADPSFEYCTYEE